MRLLAAAGMVGLLVAASAAARDAIRLKSRTIDTSAPRAATLGHHYVLQFRAPPGPEMRAELARRGIRVLGSVPDAGLMVSSEAAPALAGLGVTWAGSLAASDKLSGELGRGRYTTYLVIFHADVPAQEALLLVERRGFFILDHPDLLPGHLLVSGAFRRLQELAADDAVAYILPASPDLVAGRRVLGCAGALTEAGPVGEYVEVSPGWAKNGNNRVGLQYVFQSFTPKIEENTLRGEVARALAEWARYTNLDFSSLGDSQDPRTLNILFAPGAHGDAYPFDGPRGMLAHTFYPAPPNPEPIAGDLHLDASEDWRVGGGIDLFSVVLHEAGHALGLGHSSRPGSVMYPYYQLLTGLTADDIAGIQDLYGSPNPAAPPPTPPSHPPPITPPASPPPRPDQTPPAMRVLSPALTIAATSSASISVSGTAADPAGVTSVLWTTSAGFSGAAAGTTRWSAQVPLLVGTNVVIVRAYDAAGNSAWRALTVVRR